MTVKDEHAGTKSETWLMRSWSNGGEAIVQESDAEWLASSPEQPVHNREQRRALSRARKKGQRSRETSGR